MYDLYLAPLWVTTTKKSVQRKLKTLYCIFDELHLLTVGSKTYTLAKNYGLMTIPKLKSELEKSEAKKL